MRPSGTGTDEGAASRATSACGLKVQTLTSARGDASRATRAVMLVELLVHATLRYRHCRARVLAQVLLIAGAS